MAIRLYNVRLFYTSKDTCIAPCTVCEACSDAGTHVQCLLAGHPRSDPGQSASVRGGLCFCLTLWLSCCPCRVCHSLLWCRRHVEDSGKAETLTLVCIT